MSRRIKPKLKVPKRRNLDALAASKRKSGAHIDKRKTKKAEQKSAIRVINDILGYYE